MLKLISTNVGATYEWVTLATHAPTLLMYKKGVNKLMKGGIMVDEKYYCTQKGKKYYGNHLE